MTIASWHPFQLDLEERERFGPIPKGLNTSSSTKIITGLQTKSPLSLLRCFPLAPPVRSKLLRVLKQRLSV